MVAFKQCQVNELPKELDIGLPLLEISLVSQDYRFSVVVGILWTWRLPKLRIYHSYQFFAALYVKFGVSLAVANDVVELIVVMGLDNKLPQSCRSLIRICQTTF